MLKTIFTTLVASVAISSLSALEEEKLLIDLKNPVYTEGVLRTTEGGVITGPGIRIQAESLCYRKSPEEAIVTATGDLIIELGEAYFIAEAIEYDFNSKTGTLWNAITMIEPWFFGGARVEIHPDMSFTLYDGYVTTSETEEERDWELTTSEATLIGKQYLKAYDIKLRLFDVPLLWLPVLKTNLESIYDAPVRYDFKWGGSQGVRGTMVYEVMNWNRFKLFARLDYRINRGPGGGIETYYKSEDHREVFNTINYAALDNSISNPHEHLRFRFQGLYKNSVLDDRVSILLSWDKLSDKDMATDYNDRGLELDIAGKTELLVRKQEETRIERFISRLKVNHFQSVKQELPTLEVSWKPKLLGTTGIYSNSVLRASYLDFSYSNDILHVHDYSSIRVEGSQEFYRPIPFRYFTITPEAGGIGIYYGSTPEHKGHLLGLAYAGVEAKTAFTRCTECFKHVVEPYVRFTYFTAPTLSPNEHYIFDISDGWHQCNTMRFGVTNQLFWKSDYACLLRPLLVDLYAYGFVDTPTIGKFIPKAYLDLSYLITPRLRETITSAWDFQHGELDHFNARTEWTVNDSLALRGEYRHRSPWDWRKADHTNFILDAFRSENRLLRSQLSDRRDTLIAALFYQFDPNWALEFEARHGWNRRTEPSYTEFEIDMIGTLRSASNIKLSYQHKEGDDRVAVYFTIGLNKPNIGKCTSMLPCLEW